MRRPNGYGTIVKLSGPRRNPWAVRISAYTEKGRIQQKYLSYHSTGQAAQEALDEYNRNLAEGTAPVPDKLTTTLGQVYEQWSARKYQRCGAASKCSYVASLGRLRGLAKLKMRDITVDMLQAIIDSDEEKGLSKSSINNDAILLRALYDHAMKRDIVGKDYSIYLVIPTVGPKMERRPFTPEEFTKIKKLATDGVPGADTIVMLCYTGWRISEFLALTAESYHPDGNYLQGGMKTAAGKGRIVPVHPAIQDCLSRRMSENGATIVCSPAGKKITAAKYRDLYFTPIMSSIGIAAATPHWCRYTFASSLNKAGVDELVRKRLLGHSDKDVTEHYTKTDLAQLTEGVLALE